MATTEREHLEKYISVVARNNAKHLKIIENGFNTYPLLHISPNAGIKSFTPALSNKPLKTGEDRTIPRVSTSTHLLGCLSGTGGFYLDTVMGIDRNPEWKGGYYIYGFVPELAIKPATELLSDADYNEEIWLLAYSDKNSSYKPLSIGKIFIQDWLLINSSKDRQANPEVCNIFIENISSSSIQMTPSLHLKPNSYYTVNCKQISVPKENEHWSYRNYLVTAKQISKGEYDKAKHLSADLLSYQSLPSLNW